MKLNPWPAALLLIAAAAYFVPTPRSPFEGGHAPALQDPIGPQSRTLFERVRPATVEVEQMGKAHGEYVRYGIGTGFVIPSGQVMTAYHVVDGAQLLRIKTLSGATFAAKVAAFDNAADVALLDVDVKNLPTLNLAQQEGTVGQPLLAIGNSHGGFLQAKTGKLLRLGARARQADFPQNTLEMSAPLAPGDSGGPIVNDKGQVIGVISYVRVDEEGRTLTSYAVPVSQGSPLVQSLLSGQKKDVPALGIGFADDDNAAGGAVSFVAPGGPAAAAGVQAAHYDDNGNVTSTGDVITAVNGIRTRRANDVIFEIRRRKVGDLVTLSLKRGEESRQVTLNLVAKASIDYDR